MACLRLTERVDALPWCELKCALDTSGFALTTPVFSDHECGELAALYDHAEFRSTVVMARHRFGEG